MKKLLIISALAFFLCAGQAFASNACQEGEDFCIDNNTAYDMIEEDYIEGGSEDINVVILDVRTPEEWKWVGYPGNNKTNDAPELEGRVVKINWQSQTFIDDVDSAFASNPDVVLLTLCRSGVRSYAAAKALIAEGYTAYNINDGFEGDKDSRGYRNVNGWKVEDYSYKY